MPTHFNKLFLFFSFSTANNQGTERLVVTRRNNVPIDNNLPCSTAAVATTIAPSKLSAGNANFSTSSHIANTSGGVNINSVDAVAAGINRPVSTSSSAETSLDYKSLNSILDDNLRPLAPIPGNSRSEQIHDEHEKLVQEYWEVHNTVWWLDFVFGMFITHWNPLFSDPNTNWY